MDLIKVEVLVPEKELEDFIILMNKLQADMPDEPNKIINHDE